jgi:hypothetical protein
VSPLAADGWRHRPTDAGVDDTIPASTVPRWTTIDDGEDMGANDGRGTGA